MDRRTFVDTNADTRFVHRLRRAAKGYGYGRTAELMLDVTMPKGGENRVDIEMIASQIQRFLGQQ